jgi:hypothetical protein
MKGLAAADLLLFPVSLGGIQLGRPVDLLLDRDGLRVLGFDVLSRDEVHRFLPLAAAELESEQIVVGSPLLLLDEGELAFYRTQGQTLRSLRGARLEQDGEPVGLLRDVAVGPGGMVTDLLVFSEGSERWVPSAGLRVVAPIPTR